LSFSEHPQFEGQAPINTEPDKVPIATELVASPGSSSEMAVAPPAPPVENPVWNGWDVLVVAVLTFVTTLILPFVVAWIGQLTVYPHTGLIDSLQKHATMQLISQTLIDAAWVMLMVVLIEGKYHIPFWSAIRWNWPKGAWKQLLLGAAMLFTLSMLERVLPMPKETPFEKLFERPRDAYLLALMAVTLGPLVEELFFRGFFYPVLARRWGVGWGVFLSALPFALMHLPQYSWSWGVVLVILMVGVVCGVVRATTGSVGASFLVHIGYNGTQMLIAVLWTRGFTHMPKSLLALCG